GKQRGGSHCGEQDGLGLDPAPRRDAGRPADAGAIPVTAIESAPAGRTILRGGGQKSGAFWEVTAWAAFAEFFFVGRPRNVLAQLWKV
ncbi:MAG: hypothetical protein QOH35_1614, partial [Acidobacteriaceae bacterium]|nr:hypothetical protein [Acidobacteriaceae bacterium]